MGIWITCTGCGEYLGSMAVGSRNNIPGHKHTWIEKITYRWKALFRDILFNLKQFVEFKIFKGIIEKIKYYLGLD